MLNSISLSLSPDTSPTTETPKISPPPPQTGADQSTPPPPSEHDPGFTERNESAPSPSTSNPIGVITPSPPVSPPPDIVPVSDLASPTPPDNPVPDPWFDSTTYQPPQIAPLPQPITLSVPVPVEKPPPDPVQQSPPSIRPPSITSFQPLPLSPPPPPPPPPPAVSLLALVPPTVPVAVPVPLQAQTPPPPSLSLSMPGTPNPVLSPPINPSDTPSGSAVQVESPPTQDPSTRVPKADTSHSSQGLVGNALLVVLVLLCLVYIFVICAKRLRRCRAAKFPSQHRMTENKAGVKVTFLVHKLCYHLVVTDYRGSQNQIRML